MTIGLIPLYKAKGRGNTVPMDNSTLCDKPYSEGIGIIHDSGLQLFTERLTQMAIISTYS